MLAVHDIVDKVLHKPMDILRFILIDVYYIII